MQGKFKQLLHQYKVDIFHAQHDKKSVEEITTECMHLTEDVLKQKYHYHFHDMPNADRAEIINMINNYVVEALLPPVVEKVLRRVLVLEKRQQMLVDLVSRLLETLSDEASTSSTKAGR